MRCQVGGSGVVEVCADGLKWREMRESASRVGLEWRRRWKALREKDGEICRPKALLLCFAAAQCNATKAEDKFKFLFFYFYSFIYFFRLALESQQS